MIILFGAEIARATENHETFGFHPDFSRISLSSKKVLVLSIFRLIVEKSANCEEPLNLRQISNTLEVPVGLVRQLVDELVDAGLVVRVSRGVKEEPAFQPARPIEAITLKDALEAYEGKGVSSTPSYNDNEAQRILRYLKKIDELIQKSPENVRLKDIS